jgi:hypothetical protein
MTEELNVHDEPMFTPEMIRAGMRVTKINRPYWDGYDGILDVVIRGDKLEIQLRTPEGEINESLTPEGFCEAINRGGLYIWDETREYDTVRL